MTIKYVIGDATQPVGDGPKALLHVCNDLGLWGSGFVIAVSDRWREPEQAYRAHRGIRFMGSNQFVQVALDLVVVNMVAQKGRPTTARRVAISYPHLEMCLRGVVAHYPEHSIHMPRIGCGIAGGEWSEVEKIIERAMPDMNVTVYDLPS